MNKAVSFVEVVILLVILMILFTIAMGRIIDLASDANAATEGAIARAVRSGLQAYHMGLGLEDRVSIYLCI